MSDSTADASVTQEATKVAPRWRRLAVWVMVLLGLAALAANQPATTVTPEPFTATLDI